MTDEMNVLVTEEAETAAETIVNPDEVMATIVKRDDGYHVIDHDGTEGPVCKISADGKSICLTKNAANRQWYSVKLLDKKFAEGIEEIPLYYRATKHLDSNRVSPLPNAKLISYLPEDLQAEYKAIVDRAREAMLADKKKPLTEEEKLRARIAKMQAQLEALTATTNTEEV